MRKGSSIIEAIFAIIIIGIAVFSAQMVLIQSYKSESTINMDDVYAKCEILANEILSKPWDKSYTTAQKEQEKIFDTKSKNKNFERNGSVRIGDFNRGEISRLYYDIYTPASEISTSSSDLLSSTYTSINEYNGATTKIGSTDYKIDISYESDEVKIEKNRLFTSWKLQHSPTNETSNIKKIKITASSNNKESVQFFIFSSNIGSQENPK